MKKGRKISKSAKKFIRSEKARIRKEVLELGKQKELINKLYEQYDNKRNIQPGN